MCFLVAVNTFAPALTVIVDVGFETWEGMLSFIWLDKD